MSTNFPKLVDEEKPDIRDAFEKMKPKTGVSKSKTVLPRSPEKEKKQQISVADFFGSATIHRVESKTSATATSKRKTVSNSQQSVRSFVSGLLESGCIFGNERRTVLLILCNQRVRRDTGGLLLRPE